VAAFRMFGRPAGVPREIVPGSATSHARLSRRAEDLLGPPRRGLHPHDDTPTDPHGFPPITTDPATSNGHHRRPDAPSPADFATSNGHHGLPDAPSPADFATSNGHHDLPDAPSPADFATSNGHHRWPDAGSPAVAAAWSVAGANRLPATSPDTLDELQDDAGPAPHRVEPPDPVPHPAEAAALAAAFAADYLSWDEDDPDRRARVLGDYLADRRPVRLGWSGHGRQRADFALPGLVRPDGEGRVLVDVRVRVTPYRRVPGGRTSPADDLDDGPAVPAAAPAPAARGWRGLAGRWVRIGVAVRVEGDRLVVDAEEELDDPADEIPPEDAADPGTGPDTDLDDDAPLEMR
jgi:hypothetical protein